MADKNDGGDKTERPTPKRIRDARKKANVAKSKDVTSTAGLLGWVVLATLVGVAMSGRLADLADAALLAAVTPSEQSMAAIAASAARSFLLSVALIAIPVAVIGLCADFLQVGAILSFEKVKPKGDHLNPAEGFKRMLSLDNLVEVVKALVKTALLLSVAGIVCYLMLGRILALPGGTTAAFGATLATVGFFILCGTIGVFMLVSVLDAAYQRFSFMKKLRMSRRDIRQEAKDSEGDPQVKQQRSLLHHEWGERNAAQGARDAMALVVNPTHIAIALDYDPDTDPVPSVLAKGQDHVAQAMREAAEEAGVPVLRNVDLARELYDRVALYEIIPEDMYDAVAQVIVWAQDMRNSPSCERDGDGEAA
jgi:type III secretion protein U